MKDSIIAAAFPGVMLALLARQPRNCDPSIVAVPIAGRPDRAFDYRGGRCMRRRCNGRVHFDLGTQVVTDFYGDSTVGQADAGCLWPRQGG